MRPKPTYVDFDPKGFQKRLGETYDFRGEIGVLSYQFSKKVSAVWRFRTPELAAESAETIHIMCVDYMARAAEQIKNGSRLDYPFYNIIRADICRKFLLMGYTRSMRYHYHSSGTKWKQSKGRWEVLPREIDDKKLKSAEIFRRHHDLVASSRRYKSLVKWYRAHRTEIAFCVDRIR